MTEFNANSYKLAQIGEDDTTPWRTFQGRLCTNLNDFVLKINLKREIEARWGEVDYDNYAYTVGLMVRRTMQDGTRAINIVGMSSQNFQPSAQTVNAFTYNSYINFNLNKFGKENTGMFSASAMWNGDGKFEKAGACQSTEYFGLPVTGTGPLSEFFGGPTYTHSTDETNGVSYFANYAWGNDNLLNDLGNVASIYTVDGGDTTFISRDQLELDQNNYFWFSFNHRGQGIEGTLRDNKSRICFLGKSSQLYYNIVTDSAYPSINATPEPGSKNAGTIIPSAFSPGYMAPIREYPNLQVQFDGSGGYIYPNNINRYWQPDMSFDAVTTIILRCKKRFDQPASKWWDNRTSSYIYFSDTGGLYIDYRGQNPYVNRYFDDEFANVIGRGAYNWGWSFHRLCKFSDSSEYVNNVHVDSPEESQIWNDTRNVEYSDSAVGGSSPFSLRIVDFNEVTAVKGVGELIISTSTGDGKSGSTHCLNLNTCSQTVGNVITPVRCSDIQNAGECVSSGDPDDAGFLGWSAAEDELAFCARYPTDPICGCVNTADDEEVLDFIRIFEESTGLDLPAFCFTNECTRPDSGAWIDPRTDFSACPDDLNFCLTLIETTGSNNTIQDTDLYQDCATRLGDTSNNKDETNFFTSGTGIGLLIIGGVVLVLIIIIVIIVRSRRKASA